MFGIFRYVLALLVTFGHLKYFLQGGWNWTGLYAVFGFFVLSGYLMTRVLHRTYGYGLRGLLAYRDRALRIYPAYWATFALSLLWLLLAPESPPLYANGALARLRVRVLSQRGSRRCSS